MNLLLIRPNQEIYDPVFLNYVFIHYRQIGVFKAICARAVNQSSINQARLSNLPLPLPPLPEQRAIARVLSTVQAGIAKQNEITQTTQALKKALMHKLFTEELNDWQTRPLGEIANVSSGGTPSRDVPEFWDGGIVPWVKTGEINYNLINDTEEKITPLGLRNSSAKLQPAGTLLMAMYGQGITRGRVAILGIAASLNQACAAIIPKTDLDVLPKFLYYFFEHNYELIRNLGHGANQKN